MMIVRRGRWVYAHQQTMPVDIVGLPYDFWFELSRADGERETGDAPEPVGPEGVLYYVRFRHAGEKDLPTWPDSSGYPTLDAAMRTAAARVPSPIVWE